MSTDSLKTAPFVLPIPPLLTRASLFLRTWFFKIVITTIFSSSRIFVPGVYKKYAPTYIKKYPVRPTLQCRVFFPKSYASGTTLPLYIDIHGGGFFAGGPDLDDKFCHYFCNKFNFIVVSIEYRLAPSHPFPTGVDDCTELVLAILSDDDLPTTPGPVAVGGMSAGGTLSLCLSQSERLQSKIKALVAFYPATDFSHRFRGDYRDKPADANGKGAEKDGLRLIVPLAEWAYVPHGQDRTDSRLSPIYADRSSLPKHVYFLTAQYDKLCTEALNMARKLAGNDALREEDDWEIDGIRWERLPNETHGFIEAGWRTELFGGTRLPWEQQIEDAIERVGEWLTHIFEKS